MLWKEELCASAGFHSVSSYKPCVFYTLPMLSKLGKTPWLGKTVCWYGSFFWNKLGREWGSGSPRGSKGAERREKGVSLPGPGYTPIWAAPRGPDICAGEKYQDTRPVLPQLWLPATTAASHTSTQAVSILRSGFFLQLWELSSSLLDFRKAARSHCHKGIKNGHLCLQRSSLISFRRSKAGLRLKRVWAILFVST